MPPATSNSANVRPTIRIVSGRHRPLRNVQCFRKLAELLTAHPQTLRLDDCPDENAFINALQKESDVTIVICHGARWIDGCYLRWGDIEIGPGEVPRIGARNGIILNVCHVLAPEANGHRGWDKPQVSGIAGGRALTGGIGAVQETHVQWFVEELLVELGKNANCLSSVATTLSTFARVHRTLADRRGDRGAEGWDDLWHKPYLA